MVQEVKVFNNLTRSKEALKPISEGEVKFYSCGPTTYDFLHVGNGRALVVGDLIHRIFECLGYKVTFVRNFTDVDDQIINRANELGVSALEHSARFVDECIQDMDSLGMLPADVTPKVSETMPEIISMVETLIEKGFAYEVDGEVLYEVPKFKDYGKLSKKDLDSLQHGIRVEVEGHKKNPSDFVLWKPAKEGEPSWDSPWGKGRPGWHIECSAMSKKFLGDTFDIHHGGIDLMFPHHENEIAQSEAANGCTFSNHWVHHEFINFGNAKMSKSLGNVVTIRSFVETYGGKILRHLVSSVHYRSPMLWTQEVVDRAINDVERIHLFYKRLKEVKVGKKEINISEINELIPKMKDELANDFNLPGALASFFTMIRTFNREFSTDGPTLEVLEAIREVTSFTQAATGLVHEDIEDILGQVNMARKAFQGDSGSEQLTDQDIDALIIARKEARNTKDWAKADELRDKLSSAGVVVKDNPDGSYSWTFK
ncbi:MAG: cysteine--tRNA ligase [Halobacteriovoraceae bacterium]|jgi:cysteinyl-tRNA synthetase|nr:cysteine--tRNA ligase [Halobacteriovoraceae bacterium]MBT5095270.1 cysteine--tRNA ligase [Halobacteriovoraceae bacterium]